MPARPRLRAPVPGRAAASSVVAARLAVMAIAALTDETRWRCRQCGNLTRFDVIRSTRAREFVHVGLSGEQAVAERTVLADEIERVECRWCGRADAVEVVGRPAAVEPAPAAAPGEAG